MNAPRLPLADHLCFNVYALSIAINRLYKPLLDEMDITYPQYLVLTTLGEHGKITISEVADTLALNPSTITPLVKRLETADLIKRERNAQNERQVMVELTEKGKALQAQAQCLGEKLAVQSGMTIDQLTALNHQVLDLKAAVSKSA